MKKIHMEQKVETIIKRGEKIQVPMHYFYLCSGGTQHYLCKQRRYRGVEHFFRRDLPLCELHRHKWGRDKMVDNLMAKLPKYLADAERYADEYAA